MWLDGGAFVGFVGVAVSRVLGVVFKVVGSGVLEIFLFICWTCAVRLVMWFISLLRMVLSMVLLFVGIACVVWSEVSIGVGLLLL